MKGEHSENISENKKEGLKYIASAVYKLIKEENGCTYSYICDNIPLPNRRTLHRRIYDVLNVMKAVNLIDSKNKKYFLINSQESINRKREELNKLQDMKTVFEFIVKKNSKDKNDNEDKLFLPFMIIKTEPKAAITCDTNEERSFFTFKSSEKIELVEDLDVLKELYLNENKIQIKKKNTIDAESLFGPYFF
ncbi:Transcription factor dpl-1 [Nosema bombycis CQ1]|uniref:Transcription factor dpl-1 n=1 Tax=Nosema bombycis (strain CQ1 / CVCC 102059) TaxID=578461 RepID=R0KWB0_NOSB1|nr:Transcription factor dpl-1 [Nosema bombycis CQ1]|eukprot:EOB15196.1 Transcription factor dpl-1 [Nosema bombycis CQ1]